MGGCGLLALLLLIPLLIWCLMPDTSTIVPWFDCSGNGNPVWSPAKHAYCCANYGLGCPTTQPIPNPPTPPPTTQINTFPPTNPPTQPTFPPTRLRDDEGTL